MTLKILLNVQVGDDNFYVLTRTDFLAESRQTEEARDRSDKSDRSQASVRKLEQADGNNNISQGILTHAGGLPEDSRATREKSPSSELSDSGDVLTLTSAGTSSEWVGGKLGQYECCGHHNSAPCYRQSHSLAASSCVKTAVLYRDQRGRWCVGTELEGEFTVLVNLNTAQAGNVPHEGWYHHAAGQWRADHHLSVSLRPSPVCEVITVEVSGAAASAQPEAAGQYLVTDVWSAGHRVFMHSQRNLVLSKVPGFTNWAIRQSLASTAGCVQSAAASWCPADCRATFSQRDELRSWRFSDSEGWKEGDIKVYCETHKQNSSKDQ